MGARGRAFCFLLWIVHSGLGLVFNRIANFFNINLFILMQANYFTILYWFCHTAT